MKSLKILRSVSSMMFENLYQLSGNEILKLCSETNFHVHLDDPMITQSNEIVVYNVGERPPPFPECKSASVAILFHQEDDVIDEDIQIILCHKHSKDMYNYRHSGAMVFPGGLLEGSETPLAGCIRETEEEIYFSSKGMEEVEDEKWKYHIFNDLPMIHVNSTNNDVFPFIGAVVNTIKEKGEMESLEVYPVDETEHERCYLLKIKDLLETYDPEGYTEKWDHYEIGPVFEVDDTPQVYGVSARLLAYMFSCMEKKLLNE